MTGRGGSAAILWLLDHDGAAARTVVAI